MRRAIVTTVLPLLLFSPSLFAAATTQKPSAAYDWLDVSLEATAREVGRHGARPTIISRTLAVALTAMYDAWAAYDDKAVGSRLGASLRRPPAERTQANKEKAIAFATYRALVDVYPEDKATAGPSKSSAGPMCCSTARPAPSGTSAAAPSAVRGPDAGWRRWKCSATTGSTWRTYRPDTAIYRAGL